MESGESPTTKPNQSGSSKKEYALPTHEGQNKTTVNPNAIRVGEQLRQAREARGVKIEEVAASTHIRTTYLHLIEKGEIDALPGPTFVIGFIRLYARFLELPEQEILDQIRVQVDQDFNMLGFSAPSDQRHRPRMMLVIVGTIIFAALFMTYEKYSKNEWPFFGSKSGTETGMHDAASPPDNNHNVNIKENRNIPYAEMPPSPNPNEKMSTSAITNDSTRTTNDQVVTSPTLADTPESDDGPPPPPEEVDQEDNAAAATANTTKTAPATPTSVNVTGNEVVSIKALENVWIRVRDKDNKIIRETILKKGDTFTPTGNAPFIAAIGNAGGVQILVDNKAIPPLGDKGKVLNKLSLDPKSLLQGPPR